MQDKLSALLSNPQLMQQIMAMAQSLGQSSPAPPPPPPKPEPASPLPPMSNMDPAMIGKIMSFAGSTSIDRNQKALLCALEPYLSRGRLEKLEKAMRAAKLAGAVSAILPSGAISFLTGR
jgi:hypothetical protein